VLGYAVRDISKIRDLEARVETARGRYDFWIAKWDEAAGVAKHGGQKVESPKDRPPDEQRAAIDAYMNRLASAEQGGIVSVDDAEDLDELWDAIDAQYRPDKFPLHRPKPYGQSARSTEDEAEANEPEE
jgi:hypothetical protein